MAKKGAAQVGGQEQSQQRQQQREREEPQQNPGPSAPSAVAPLDDLLTLSDAAALVGKTPSNISYLLQYRRLRKYDASGRVVRQAKTGGLRVSRRELLGYVESWDSRVRSRMESLRIGDTSLAFLEVPERQRTKHVHRLHPYLGKFIPQLVGHFLPKYFKPGQVVLDPFSGSGTTLVEAGEMGMASIGMDISEFNVLISRVKLTEYEIPSMEREVLDITKRTVEFSAKRLPTTETISRGRVSGGYLETWFAKRSLAEMLYFRSLIGDYVNRDLLMVLLSRTARSCRLVHHYDLATPKEPVRAPYKCYKHRGRTCSPVTTIVPRLKFYSVDTIRRIKEYHRVRRSTDWMVMKADSRTVKLDDDEVRSVGRLQHRPDIQGIFTSPPYVGQIDYHEQHRYAYELFGIARRDELEIGSKKNGKGDRARRDYSRSMSKSLSNLGGYLSPNSAVLLVANDRFGLYPDIFREAGMYVEKSFLRPVEDRTERDKQPYSETVFLARMAKKH